MNIIKNKYNKSYFESIGFKKSKNSQRDRLRLEQVLCYKDTGKLLEIGFGKGGFLDLAARHFDVEGIDISPYAIASVKCILGDRIRKGDIESEQLRSDRYEVIVGFGVFEHLARPDYVVDRVYNGLTDDGIMIGSVPNNSPLIGRVVTALTNLVDGTHCSTYPPHHWRSIFEKSGFKRVHFFGEITLSRNHSVFVKSEFWKYISFNLMFLCEK